MSVDHENSLDKNSAFMGKYVRLEVVFMVTMKNAVFLDVTPCSSFENRFG
jgi:hypothetical protein